MALRVGEVIERNMIAVRIGPELRQVAVATPEYVETHGQPEHRRDLLQHPCIRWRWPGRSTPYAWEFFENGTWFDVVVDGPLIVHSREAALGAVLNSIGIGFVIEDTVTELFHQKQLLSQGSAYRHYEGEKPEFSVIRFHRFIGARLVSVSSLVSWPASNSTEMPASTAA